MDKPLEQRARSGAGLKPSVLLATLREDGAAGFDAVRMHYLETLAARAATQPAAVRGVLDARLGRAIAELRSRFEASRAKTDRVKGASARTGTAPLAMLVSELSSHTHATMARNQPRAELRAVVDFRNTWSKLSADKHVSAALSQAPQNAGPINSHMLMLRSLALMRTISPDYLNRFLSYADALLSLEQDGAQKVTSTKKSTAAKAAKK